MTTSEKADNPRAVVGGNMPPSKIDDAWSVYRAVSAFLEDMPAVCTEADAERAKGFLDRAKFSLDELETDRDSKVRPLNENVRAINADFKAVSVPLDKLKAEISSRLRTFTLAEEAKRAAIAAEAARVARAAADAARAAEAAEAEAIANAAQGEFTDAGTAIAEANAAFEDFTAAAKAADVARRETKVRIGAGTGRAFTLRTTETLAVSDGVALLQDVLALGGMPTKVNDALLTAARDYRKLKGNLPRGVSVTHERV